MQDDSRVQASIRELPVRRTVEKKQRGEIATLPRHDPAAFSLVSSMDRFEFLAVQQARQERRIEPTPSGTHLKMRRLSSTILLAGVAGLLAAAPVLAQPASPAGRQDPPAPAQPAPSSYRRVPVTITALPRDTTFEAFRKDLAEIAKRKDRIALAQRVVPRDFFWERDFSGGFDAGRPSIDNLAAALTLEADDGTGWEALAGFAAEPSAGRLPGRPAVICSPAIPQFDEDARDELVENTHSDGLEWNYPRTSGLPVRAGPQPNAAVIETLGLHFVRVLGFDEKDGDTDPVHNAWARVVTPSGKTGFVAPNSLLSPYADRLCYGKEGSGPWRIVGYVGGGD